MGGGRRGHARASRCAVAAPSVIGALSIFYTRARASACSCPIVAGLYVRRVGQPEALAAIGAGHRGHGRGPPRDARHAVSGSSRLPLPASPPPIVGLRGRRPGSPPPRSRRLDPGPPFRNGCDFPGNSVNGRPAHGPSRVEGPEHQL